MELHGYSKEDDNNNHYETSLEECSNTKDDHNTAVDEIANDMAEHLTWNLLVFLKRLDCSQFADNCGLVDVQTPFYKEQKVNHCGQVQSKKDYKSVDWHVAVATGKKGLKKKNEAKSGKMFCC